MTSKINVGWKLLVTTVAVEMLVATTVLAACPNTTGRSTDAISLCTNCSDMKSRGDAGCAYHTTDVTAYCDCNSGYQCGTTGNTYQNKIITTHNGVCQNGTCVDTEPPSTDDSVATVTEKNGTPCAQGS